MKLQFTNGYRPDFNKISRVLGFLSNQRNRKRILHDEIVTALGIPYRQIRSIISIMNGFGLVNNRGNTLTAFGKALASNDPYFQNPDSLWIIHYKVASNSSLLVWNRVINKIIPNYDSFSLTYIFENFFNDIKPNYSDQTINEKLPREIRSVLESYTNTELSRLQILGSQNEDSFVRGSPIAVSGYVFLYCLLEFRDSLFPGSSAITIEDICTKDNSPGSVFALSMYQLRSHLEELNNKNLLRLEQFGNLDQIRLIDSIAMEDILKMVYGELHAN